MPSLLAAVACLAGAAPACRRPAAPAPATAPTAGDGARDRPDAGRPAPGAAGPRPALRWTGDGSRLVAGGRWLLDWREGHYLPIACPFDGAPAACPCCDSALSPDGARALHLGPEALEIDLLPLTLTLTLTLTGPRRASRAIPRWIADAVEPTAAQDVINVGLWLSPRVVLVQQLDRAGALAPACRICELPSTSPSADVRACRWRRPPRCLDPDFAHLTGVDPGPHGLLALHSEGEGHFALGVVRYDPDAGQSDTATPSVRLEGSSAVSVRFAADGSRVDLISPCELREGENHRPPPCDDADAQPAWRLYSRPVGPGPLELRRADLPPGAVLHPDGQRFAWPRDHAICVGDPGARSPACFPLPP
jgi:hypothetical protein